MGVHKHKTFALPFPLYLLLVLLNLGLAIWINTEADTPWGLVASDFHNIFNPKVIEIVAIVQVLLFAVTLDMSIRSFVVFFNKHNPNHQIATILVQVITIVSYALVCLLVYVVVYDKSFTNLIAASGMIVVAIAYAFREMLANIMASVQLQMEGLISINDWIEVTESTPSQFFQVVQIDKQMVTLMDVNKHHIRVPNREFLTYKYINLTKQPLTKGSRRKIRFEITNNTPITLVLEILDQAMKSIVETNPKFNPFYYCLLVEIKSGVHIYEIKYECEPSLTRARSDHVVNTTVMQFLLAGGANINYTVEIYPANPSPDYVKQRLLAIREFGILRDLNEREIDLLAKTVQMVRFRSEDVVIRYQQQADSMFIVVEGVLDVYVPNQDQQMTKVASLWPGSCVGEMSLMTGEPRSAQVIARNESVLLEIGKQDLAPILESNPRLVEKMAELLAFRIAHNKTALAQGDKSVEKHRLITTLAQKITKFLFNR